MVTVELQAMACQHCARILYRTDGSSIRAPTDDELDHPVRPIELLISQRLRVLFCSSECASRWIYEKPTEELLGGYPLW